MAHADAHGIRYTYERDNDGARIQVKSASTGKLFSNVELPPAAIEMLRGELGSGKAADADIEVRHQKAIDDLHSEYQAAISKLTKGDGSMASDEVEPGVGAPVEKAPIDDVTAKAVSTKHGEPRTSDPSTISAPVDEDNEPVADDAERRRPAPEKAKRRKKA